MWVLEDTPPGAIAKVTTSGVVTTYPAPFQNDPQGLVAAGDGALWFGQNHPNGVGRITTSGVVSQVPVTTTNAQANGLAVASDGRLWVAEVTSGAIGRLSPIGGSGKVISATHAVALTGTVAEFVDGTPAAVASDFTAGIDWGDGSTSAGSISGPTGGPFLVRCSHSYANPGIYKISVSLHDTVDDSNYSASAGEAKVH